ncbi:MAG: ABC transporter permease, partial [Coriobacteriia bacterium]|nr:ABC transporter permease [Coriobacteriia bacterium]
VLTLVALLLSILFAALITAVLHKIPKVGEYVQGSLSALYSVPSLALFALSIPLFGIGQTTAIIVLVAYNQFLLVRNFAAGLAQVDPGLTEAARSLGLTQLQVFTYIQLPLAMPVFIAGIRLATISTIGIATIASLIDAGGLGVLLFSGLRTGNLNQLLWATLLAAALALFANVLLTGIERFFKSPDLC